MPTPDRELPETLDLIAQLVASVSDRLDRQGQALDRLAKAQGQLHTQAQAAQAIQARGQASPDHVANLAAQALRNTLLPELQRIEDTLIELGGGLDRKRGLAGQWGRRWLLRPRWPAHPLAVVLGIPLALAVLLAALMPGAVAQTPLTCRAVGGIWWGNSERYSAACLFEAYGSLHQATGVEEEDG